METISMTDTCNAAGRACRYPWISPCFSSHEQNCISADQVLAKTAPNGSVESAITKKQQSVCSQKITATSSSSELTSSNNASPSQSVSVDTKTAKGKKKRSRASRSTPTILVSTDMSNFKDKVQKFTGMPAAFPRAEAHVVVDSKRPLLFKPMPHRPLHQSLSASVATRCNANSILPNLLISASHPTNFLSDQTSSQPKFPFHPLLQQKQQPTNSFLQPTVFNSGSTSRASNGLSERQTNICFEELWEELGLDMSAI
eukprot:Gb_23443 [translate_table: standard]